MKTATGRKKDLEDIATTWVDIIDTWIMELRIQIVIFVFLVTNSAVLEQHVAHTT
jgi:hypothetical protein